MGTDSGALPSTLSMSPPSHEPDHVQDSAAIEAAPKKKAAVTAAPESDTERKIRRAKRFGITVQLSEQEKRDSRAERFGTMSSPQTSELSKQSEELKRKARAERFGILVPTDDDAKKKSRLERFTPASKAAAPEEDKRKARAIRFSQAPVSSLSINGKGIVEPKVPVAGKAGGGP